MARILSVGFAAILVAAGTALAGWFVGNGIQHRQAERVVTVKGLAERDVKADLAVWPLRFVAAGNDLTKVEAQIQQDMQAVTAFLGKYKLDGAVAHRDLQVTDRAANTWGNDRYQERFIVAQTLMVRSSNVEAVYQAAQATQQLVQQGVVLSSQSGPGNGGPVYLFTQLNRIKPALIAEATRNARAAAAQFAKDADSALGDIISANQGVIQILPRDPVPGMGQQQQVQKTVRVVSTLRYALH